MTASRLRFRGSQAAKAVSEAPLRAHGDGARRRGSEKPVADAQLFVRLPKDDLRWLKVYAAQNGRTLTDLAQEWVRSLRQADAEGR
jgi:hypothetical protein